MTAVEPVGLLFSATNQLGTIPTGQRRPLDMLQLT